MIEPTYEIQEWWEGAEGHEGRWVFLHSRTSRMQFKTQEDALFHIMKCEPGKYRLLIVNRQPINQPIIVK